MDMRKELRIKRAVVGLCIIGAYFSPSLGIAQTPSSEAAADTQDCAVIAAAGEDQLKWRESSPSLPMLADSYGANCNWSALGIKHFDISTPGSGPYPGSRFSFSKPEYSSDGNQAELNYSIGGSSWPHSRFYALYACTAKKIRTSWHVTDCRLKIIT